MVFTLILDTIGGVMMTVSHLEDSFEADLMWDADKITTLHLLQRGKLSFSHSQQFGVETNFDCF